MDEFAAHSPTKAARAHNYQFDLQPSPRAGGFSDELVPVPTPNGLATTDESVRTPARRPKR